MKASVRARLNAGIAIFTPPNVHRIITRAASDYSVQVRNITDSSDHDPRVVLARRQAAKQINSLGYSVSAVGRFLGLNHSSVIYALKQASPKRLPGKYGIGPAIPLEPVKVPDLSGEWAI